MRHVSELVQRPVEGVRITADDRAVASETTSTAAGPSVLVLITAVAELGITVTSTYIGHEGTDTLAAHLIIDRDREDLHHATQARHALPVTHARARCLLDHAAHVQEAMRSRAESVAIDVDPNALSRAALI